MSNKYFLTGLLAAVLAVSFAPVADASAPYGTLTAQCLGGAVYLEWGSRTDANSNGLQKGDSYPADPQNFWGWLPTDSIQRTYTDYAVVPRVTYSYRVKYRPELPSNVVSIACPVPTPVVTPTPTPVYTPTPASVPGSLALGQYGRNITRGQAAEYSSVVARGNETLDIILHVRDTSATTLTNVYLTDLLPVGLGYINQSTALNGVLVADGITSSGLNIGTLWPNQEVVVRFSVMVDPNSVPGWGQVTVLNTAQVRADNAYSVSASLPVTLGTAQSIAAISRVKTGPADSILLALLAGMAAAGLYGLYTTTDFFGRRYELAKLRDLVGRAHAPNFLRE